VVAGTRRLTRADLDWVVDLAAARRERLVPFAPRFWRRAPDARAVHREFLGGLIDSTDGPAIRTDHGFLFGIPQDGRIVVDDLALPPEASWAVEGDALLRRAAEAGPLRVVCPVPEESRRAAVIALGLEVVESWWHRDLERSADRVGESSEPEAPGADARLSVEGAEGRLVTAPPVYAPGGPVLLATSVPSSTALEALERLAARRGAPVAVVSLSPADRAGAQLLSAAGYRRTTDFFEQPA
jgi:hypothetical protein